EPCPEWSEGTGEACEDNFLGSVGAIQPTVGISQPSEPIGEGPEDCDFPNLSWVERHDESGVR
ncbi:MAG TPA: hypothetical protein VE974_04285, partial [Thermoanaerobaculia bacterium]|nr:hypothetical protein [Thermoanaerobaculia bacterium]